MLLFLAMAALLITPALREYKRVDTEAVYFAAGEPPFAALTFEPLWSSQDLDLVLGILGEKNVSSTFFISGGWLKQNREAALRILTNGHEIGNHTLTHANLLHLEEHELRREIGGFNKLSHELLEYVPGLFRPPLGLYNGAIVQEALLNRCRTIIWSVESYDTISASSDEIVRRVLDRAKGGSIIVFRVGSEHLPEALPAIIDGLRARGYEPVTVSRLIETIP